MLHRVAIVRRLVVVALVCVVVCLHMTVELFVSIVNRSGNG
jgi:hypothetical protein